MSDAELCDRIGLALSSALAEDDEMVTRWVAVIETIDTDGDRALWTMAPDGTQSWDALGMLTFAVQREQAHATLRTGEDEGE